VSCASLARRKRGDRQNVFRGTDVFPLHPQSSLDILLRRSRHRMDKIAADVQAFADAC